MTKNNCFILLDRSGSMQTHWEETLGSINGFVEKLKIDGNVILAVFDSLSYDIIRNSKPADWKKVTSKEVTPRGGTPLLDAAGRLLWSVLDSGSERAMVVVMTDGEENQSKLFKKENITDLTKQIEAKKYELIFLGANFEKIDTNVSYFREVNTAYSAARSLNMTTQNFAGTMDLLSAKASGYYATGAAVEFNDEEKAAAKK